MQALWDRRAVHSGKKISFLLIHHSKFSKADSGACKSDTNPIIPWDNNPIIPWANKHGRETAREVERGKS